MTKRLRWMSPFSTVILLICAQAVAWAEVSVDPSEAGVNTIIMGIIDDADPISVLWQPFRPLPSERILNSSGYARGDGRPDLGFRVIGDDSDSFVLSPVVVWAYNAGSDHDIAIAEWTGTTWSSIEFLTNTTVDELDPRIFVEGDGTLHVTWWTMEAPQRVLLARKPTGSSTWDAPIEVIAGCRRPSVAVHDTGRRVSCERDSMIPGVSQEVVILREESGSFIEEAVMPTSRSMPLESVLHVAEGQLWIDWKSDGQTLGYVEYTQGSWSVVGQESWLDPTWLGVESSRKAVENQLLD